MKLLSLFLCLIFTLTVTGFEPTNTLTIDNQSSYGAGTVTVAGTGGSTSVSVPSPGVYVSQIGFTPSSVTINGQTATYPSSLTVTLPGSQQIKVQWTATNYIELVDMETWTSPNP